MADEITGAVVSDTIVCPNCGNDPIKILKTPAHGDYPPIYEVGCILCPPKIIDTDEGKRRMSYSARGYTPELALEKWNNKDFLVDAYIDRI